MRTSNRKSAPEVAGGRVQKKNNHALTPNYYSHPQRELVFDRKRPGEGYRHLLKKKDILAFIDLLPDWNEMSEGLDAIVLAPGKKYAYGYFTPGVVHIRAWTADLWTECSEEYFQRDRFYISRLGVPCEPDELGYVCKFTPETAKAYQLLCVLLHELGHHHDLMTTRSKSASPRGERYSDRYGERYAARIWDAYCTAFDLPV